MQKLIMALKNKLISFNLLLILPLIFGAVQGAALHRHQQENCDSTPLGAMVQKFYCTSDLLRKLSKFMFYVRNDIISIMCSKFVIINCMYVGKQDCCTSC